MICNEIENIKQLAEKIEYIISNTDIKCKGNIAEYKLSDLQNIDTVIKQCKSCKKYFIPSFYYKNHQQYCTVTCRDTQTTIKKYQSKLDERQRPIDLLRKTIYERKYRTIRDNKLYKEEDYNVLLLRLKALNKKRWELSEKEYNSTLEDVHINYLEIVAKEKGQLKYE